MSNLITPYSLARMARARKHGIRMPFRAWRAAQATGVPYAVVCAFLMQETSGGQNIFGHDPTIFVGAGQVTKPKYLAYRAKRRAGGGMQGVGPMQLTWWEFQDEADAAGGCWKPYVNILVGCRLLARYRDTGASWHEVARRYNGAEAYADQMDRRFDDWRRWLNT